MKPNRRVHYALSLPAAAVALTNAIAYAQVPAKTPPRSRPLNVILVLRDQMRHDLPAAAGYNTPALDRLAQQGISFRNNYIASAMCTPSRAALWSGTPPQVNGLFDQAEMGYAVSLRKDRPNMGSMMGIPGTAYLFPSLQVRSTDPNRKQEYLPWILCYVGPNIEVGLSYQRRLVVCLSRMRLKFHSRFFGANGAKAPDLPDVMKST